MSVNICKNGTLSVVSGRVADEYTKAETDAKISEAIAPINTSIGEINEELSTLESNSVKIFEQTATTNQNGFANITAPIDTKIISAMTTTKQAQVSIVVADDGSCYAFRFTTYTGAVISSQSVKLIYAYI